MRGEGGMDEEYFYEPEPESEPDFEMLSGRLDDRECECSQCLGSEVKW